MPRRSLIMILAILLSVATAACSNTKTEERAGSEVKQGRMVEVATVNKELLETDYTLSGTLQPVKEAAVAFELAGRVIRTNAEIGDSVKKGASLAKLAMSEFQLKVEQAEQGILQAKAGLNQAEQGALQAKAALSSADASIKGSAARVANAAANQRQVEKGARKQDKLLAENGLALAQAAYKKASIDTERSQKLYEQGLVSQTDNENAQLNLKNAEKTVKDAEASMSRVQEGATQEEKQAAAAMLEEATSGMMASRADKEQAEAAHNGALAAIEQAISAYNNANTIKKEAELALSKTLLAASFNGVVLTKEANSGDIINPGQTIYKLGDVRQLKVLLPLPDSEVGRWKKGAKVDVGLYGEVRKGTVSKIYPQTNAGTGTISVEVIIPNEKQDWIAGQVVKAGLKQSGSKVILVPVTAVISNGGKPHAFRAVNGKAVKTAVEVGSRLVDNKLEIVSGLKEGELIIVKGAETLFDGDKIEAAGGAVK